MGEQKSKTETVRQVPRPLREDGYNRPPSSTRERLQSSPVLFARTATNGPRPLREDGYKREDGDKCGDGYTRASRPRSYGLEGRPFIARGEPRFAAEPREYGRRQIGGRAQDMAIHRRSPSPQQAEPCLAGRKKTGRQTSMRMRG